MADKYAVRNLRLCTKECLCLYVCPTGATDTENSIIDVDKCIGCMHTHQLLSLWGQRNTRLSSPRKARWKILLERCCKVKIRQKR